MMEDKITLLKIWLKRARQSAFAHYVEAKKCSVRHYLVGVPTIVISAVVGTTVFASLASTDPIVVKLKIAVGVMSVIAAVLRHYKHFCVLQNAQINIEA